ncbi:high-affinity Zn(2+) transporter zrt1, partial [Borealophlyctis nickersoniae]
MSDIDTPVDAVDACYEVLPGTYEYPIHIAAVFMIFGASLVGSVVPFLMERFWSSQFTSHILSTLKLFSSGILLSTSLIHMFIPATTALTHDCLPEPFRDYGAWAAALGLFGILLTQMVQVTAGEAVTRRKEEEETIEKTRMILALAEGTGNVERTLIYRQSGGEWRSRGRESLGIAPRHCHDGRAVERKVAMGMLEGGVAVHSVIVGVTLGVARENFSTLLIALLFSQFFKGIALSTVITQANLKSKLAKIFMVLS